MDYLFEGAKRSVGNTVAATNSTADNRITVVQKKAWCKPAFEIISKEVVKGGAGSSSETNHAYS